MLDYNGAQQEAICVFPSVPEITLIEYELLEARTPDQDSTCPDQGEYY